MAEEPLPSARHGIRSKRAKARICHVESVQPIILQCARLPPELIDIIINLLHLNRRTLRTCALVCKSWVPASRRHLFPFFSTFHIDRANDEKMRILSAPLCTIASAVRHVVIELAHCQTKRVPCQRDPGSLLTLFSRLSKTTQLTLRGLHDHSPRFEFATLAPLSQQLECLVLRNVQFGTLKSFFSLLRSFPRLQRVACSGVSFKIPLSKRQPRTLPNDQDLHMPELRVLEMCSSSGLLSRLMGRWGNAIPQLTMLCTDFQDDLEPSMLIETVGTSLQKLEIFGASYNFPSVAPGIALTHLEHLKLVIQGNPEQIGKILLHALRHLTSTHLKEVEVFNKGFFLGIGDCAAWSQIDSLLQFQPALRTLSFGFIRPLTPQFTIEETVVMKLPLCTERGILRFVPWAQRRGWF